MFIAMNRFRVRKGSEADFESVWANRDSRLPKVPGFVEFHLLKGPEQEAYTLYSSHTQWQTKATFEAWTNSEGRAMQAALVEVNGEEITFLMNGAKVPYQLNKLSPASQKRVEELTKASK